jgi:hypothetical protein
MCQVAGHIAPAVEQLQRRIPYVAFNGTAASREKFVTRRRKRRGGRRILSRLSQRAWMIEHMILAGFLLGGRKSATSRRRAGRPRITTARPICSAREQGGVACLTCTGEGRHAGTCRNNRYGLQFFYRQTLGRAWAPFGGKGSRRHDRRATEPYPDDTVARSFGSRIESDSCSGIKKHFRT